MLVGILAYIKLLFHTKSAPKRLISLPLFVTIRSISNRHGVFKAVTHKEGIGLLTLSIPELRTSS
jgi:hypothetical protein